MTTGTAPHAPTPERFFAAIKAYEQTAAIKAAIELDLFTAVSGGNASVPGIAAHCKADEKGIRVLCDFLTVQGFLTKTDGNYSPAPDAQLFLDRRSPAYMGSAIEFLLAPVMTEAFSGLTAAVRKGGTILQEDGTMTPDHPVWVRFARAMAPMVAMPADQIASVLGAHEGAPWKVLDIAAGHGLFGIAVARANPNAQVYAVDWPKVLDVAHENAESAGVAQRFHRIEGSAFDVDYGSGYDVVLLTNFLHHFDTPTCEHLLRKVHSALSPGGRAATLEFVPNDDRVSPPHPAQFALTMLATTPRGDAYTFKELEQMFKAAGFRESALHRLEPDVQSVIVSTK